MGIEYGDNRPSTGTEIEPGITLQVGSGIGKPGSQSVPDSVAAFFDAFAPLWHTPTIMANDAKLAEAAGQKTTAVGGALRTFGDSIGLAKDTTATLLAALGMYPTSIDPDTGGVHMQSGGQVLTGDYGKVAGAVADWFDGIAGQLDPTAPAQWATGTAGGGWALLFLLAVWLVGSAR